MKIPSFSSFVGANELQPLVLRDSVVIVDSLNFFFDSYAESGLQYELGCECHRYASFLRKWLSMFEQANITCYFIHKGGNKNMEKRLNTVRESRTICPVFMDSVYMEVLDEMGFEYVTCEYESKKDVIELAQALDCPVISFDIEFCFSGLRYIPSNQIEFDEMDNRLLCRYFTLETFMHKYRLTPEKIAIFIVLTDEQIFPKNFFVVFFKRIAAPLHYYKERNIYLLKWLSRKEKDDILELIFRYLSAEDESKFVEELEKAEQFIFRREAGGLGAACLLDRAAAAVTRGDPDWFAKGVAGKHIVVQYIPLYRNQKLFIDHPIGPENPLLLSLTIIKYAYDLLTNFKNDGFTLLDILYSTDSGMETMLVSEMYSVRKPEYEARESVFENGWAAVSGLGLLQHFLREALRLEAPAPARLPAGARLLALALLYFSRRKTTDTSAEAACVLLSYTTLSLVLENCDRNNLPTPSFDAQPKLAPTTDRETVTDADCNMAAAVMADCPSLREDTEEIDKDLLRPLMEFQHVLCELNNLNVLCGAPYQRTVYSRTYSGSLVYRLRRACADDWRSFLDELLSPAPTVHAFFNGLVEVYEEMLNGI